MLVMCIRIMRMPVLQPGMLMEVPMACARCDREVMCMLVMFIMRVFMLMRHFCMEVFMRMLLRQMQPHAPGHQATGQHQPRRDRLAQQQGTVIGEVRRVVWFSCNSPPFFPFITMRVLLVEDDLILADGLSRVLRMHGMAVDIVATGDMADMLLQHTDIAVLVLDIGLPGMDGFEVVRRLRARGSSLPVLLLTARDAISDRVRGLELGADDYLVKPFATLELVARIKALVRRSSPQSHELQIGNLSLDQFSKRAYINGKSLELSVREWAVLEYLIQQIDRVVSKQQIIDAILTWNEDVSLNAVEVYVSRIRTKIAESNLTIRTIRGFGYVLEKQETKDQRGSEHE